MSPAWLNKLLHKPQAVVPALTSTPSLPSNIDIGSLTIGPGTSDIRFETSTVPRIFALVVAIDKYKDPTWRDLTGCKNDGERFIDFLTGVLGVPLSRVAFLADEEATYRNILDKFGQFLIRNAEIRRDDSIIFYFAGHGSQLVAPEGWVTESNKIEILCPHDVYTTGDDGEDIWGISDRAINALMRELAFRKGDNIVAVFDCCHSGGLSRGEGQTLRVRYIPPPSHPPPADLNQEVWASVSEPCGRSATTVVQTGFLYKAMASHVLLAACRPDESAMEDPFAKDKPGGLFTAALVECLRRCSLHDTSYLSLFEMLDVKHPKQHPQCEGMNKDRLLFSVNTLHNDGQTTFKVYERGNRLCVSAGSIHGIIEGTEFQVTSSTQTVILKAKKVRPFGSILDGSRHNITITDARATVSRWHHPMFRVHSPLHLSSAYVAVVPADEPADAALHQNESDKWELERFDTLIPVYSSRFVYFEAGASRMTYVLDEIANFNSYLYRSDSTAASFSRKVNLKLNRMGNLHGESGPIGDDLLEVPRTSHSGVDVKEAIITDLGSKYCFTTENFSGVDLFPYFFYFDPSDYSIESWYMPPSPTMAAPLKRREEDGTASLFALGYGGFGTDPIEFYLPKDEETDSGFLKVFLTTTYVDMTNVPQSPIGEVSAARKLMYTLKGAWACETFVLTCKRS